MVSSLDFSSISVHVGVTRRSVTKWGSLLPLEAGVVMMTEMSVGVGWKAMIGDVDRMGNVDVPIYTPIDCQVETALSVRGVCSISLGQLACITPVQLELSGGGPVLVFQAICYVWIGHPGRAPLADNTTHLPGVQECGPNRGAVQSPERGRPLD